MGGLIGKKFVCTNQSMTARGFAINICSFQFLDLVEVFYAFSFYQIKLKSQGSSQLVENNFFSDLIIWGPHSTSLFYPPYTPLKSPSRCLCSREKAVNIILQKQTGLFLLHPIVTQSVKLNEHFLMAV